MDLPSSFGISRAISNWESSRFTPRRAPSTSRRYRSFSPSFISQFVIMILQIAIGVKRKNAGGAGDLVAGAKPASQPTQGRLRPRLFLFAWPTRKGEAENSPYAGANAAVAGGPEDTPLYNGLRSVFKGDG